MKLKLKTDGLEGDNLKFVQLLNEKFEQMPEGLTKEDISKEIKSTFKGFFGDDGELTVLDNIKALEEELNGEKEGSIKDILKKQGITLTELKNRMESNQSEKSLIKILEEKNDEFKDIQRTKKGQVIIEVKAAAVTTVAGSITNGITTATGLRLGDGELFEAMRGPAFVFDFANLGNTNAAFLIWWDEQPKDGDFAITAEGVLKPMLQYKFERKSSDYKKAAGYAPLTDEFMNDFPGLVTTIKRLMAVDCRLDINTQLMTDLLALAPTFTYTGLNASVATPDNYAAIGAAICQVQSLFFTPNVILLNPGDAWSLRLVKDANGRYQMPPIQFNGSTYEFGRVIVNPGIAAGNFLVGDGSMFNVDMKGNIILRIGYNSDDFIKNQQTVVVEQYFYDYMSSNRVGAFCYGNFATIKTAIASA